MAVVTTYLAAPIEPFNTNNFPTDVNGDKVSREKYAAEVQKTSYDSFFPFLSDEEKRGTILRPISKSEAAEFLELTNISAHRDLHDGDFEDRFDKVVADVDLKLRENGGGDWFVRLSECSPKDAPGGCLVRSGLDVVRAITRSARCATAFRHADPQSIVLKKWRADLDRRSPASDYGKWEFRTFIYNGRLTAVSQYHCHDAYDWTGVDLEAIAQKSAAVAARLAQRGLPFDSYVLDVLCPPHRADAEIVELNPFGMEMSSGSALYDWQRDVDRLYGRTEVEVRVLHKLGCGGVTCT